MKKNKAKILGIICARGGSKSIPLKNIKKFCGKPLIAWSILTAKRSKYIDRLIVSTDSPEIAKVAKEYGAEVPFLRPAELAVDWIGIEPVLKHAYEWLRDNEKYKADIIVHMLPTTPARQTFHIDEAVKLFMKTKPDSVIGVNETPANHTPYWTLVKNKNAKVTLWGGVPLENILVRRQLFPQKCYARNDLIYVIKPENLFKRKPDVLGKKELNYGKKVELYVVPETSRYEMDINTPEDWKDAEFRFRHFGLSKINNES